MRIVVLAGGIGGARFLLGVRAHARDTGAEVTAVVNVGDDVRLHGLRICPDLDSVMYTLGGGADPERGWGRVGETWAVKEELAAYGAEPTWFGLGDRDIATHLVRTRMLDAGYPLSAVTEALCARWQPGVRLLPATDDRLETHVVVDVDGGRSGPSTSRSGGYATGASVPPHRFVFVGAETAKPAPGVLDALAARRRGAGRAEQPGGEHRADPRRARAARGAGRPARRRWSGCRPIIGGAPVRGMADRCLAAIGVRVQRGRGRRGSTAPGRERRHARRLAGGHGGRGRGGARRDGPRGATVDDRRGGDGGDGRGARGWRGRR